MAVAAVRQGRVVHGVNGLNSWIVRAAIRVEAAPTMNNEFSVVVSMCVTQQVPAHSSLKAQGAA